MIIGCTLEVKVQFCYDLFFWYEKKSLKNCLQKPILSSLTLVAMPVIKTRDQYLAVAYCMTVNVKAQTN